jgi:DNA polymerase III epsilon subunit-like protein
MTKICFIYTDTNGLHKTKEKVSTKNLYKFARLIAIHYMVGEYNGTFNGNKFNELFRKDIILKPKTINFDPAAMKIHKITPEMAKQNGIDNITAITTLEKDLMDVDIIVSFNLEFHLKAILVECFRTAIPIEFNKKTLICMASFGHTFEFPKYNDMIKTYNITKQHQLDMYKDLFFVLYNDYKKGLSSKPTVVEEDDGCDFVD